MTSLEAVLARSMLWMTVGAAAAVPVLFLPQPEDPLLTSIIHLSVVVAFGIALAFHLAPLGDEPWFEGLAIGRRPSLALTWAVIVIAITGVVGITTLATSAALRYDASLQFLQLLSALDITWAGAAIVLGSRRRFGGGSALFAAGLLLVVCVWSIWRYLDVVGFTESGGWLVDGSELLRLVLPYDMGAAAVALILFSAGVRTEASEPRT